jgi:hypothetical protein
MQELIADGCHGSHPRMLRWPAGFLCRSPDAKTSWPYDFYEGQDMTAANRTQGSCRSPIVRGKALTVARWIGRGTFKAAALIGAFVLIIALWLWDASILTRAADQNLQLIKAATRVLPPDWASKTESALRMFGADRALLLVEGVAVAKLIMLGIAQPFRRRRP